MGINPSGTKGDNLPVTNITWYDAVQYCNRLSVAEGLTPCYSVSGTTVTWNKAANGYRLPTEAEWEYAARAATATPFHFGDYVHNSDANCYNAYGYNNDASGSWVNGSDAYLRKTVAVDQYPANAYGLYNMHGNVAEWVWDWYGRYGSGAVTDPVGPEIGNAKIVRGGGWNDHPKHIRSAYRGAQPADLGLYSIGVRPVRSAETAAGEVKSVYSARADQKTGKTLIVYFSQTGNTEGLANLIHEMSGADIFRLERKMPYSSSSNGPVLYGEALDELRAEAVPELKAYPDIGQYDTILLGYCNWWSSIPASVRSFLLHDDFSGKTIVPFCSMGGGHFGQTISAIAKLAPDSVIREGLEVTYSSYDRNEISAWLEKSLSVQGGPEPDATQEPQEAQQLPGKGEDSPPESTAIVRLSAGKKSFTIRWKKRKDQVDGYEIAYSISSRFPKKSTKIAAAGKSESSKTISKLKAGKKYYVRIRAYKTVKVQGDQKNLYAGWSKVKTVKVKK